VSDRSLPRRNFEDFAATLTKKLGKAQARYTLPALPAKGGLLGRVDLLERQRGLQAFLDSATHGLAAEPNAFKELSNFLSLSPLAQARALRFCVPPIMPPPSPAA